MVYADLLLAVSPGCSNDAVIGTGAELARDFGAGVIGVAACRPVHTLCLDYQVPSAIFAEDRKQIESSLRKVELEFRSALQDKVKRLEWRAHSTTEDLADHLAREGRSADLLIVASERGGTAPDPTRFIDLRNLVMQSARPVLVVPQPRQFRPFERVLVAWKDTREAQRAIADAFPFMAQARMVNVAAIASGDSLAEARSQTAEVALWLDHHGIKARCIAVESSGTHASKLDAIADDLEADLIVAGAHGYSRQRDWVLGGVTSNLLQQSVRCSLLSH